MVANLDQNPGQRPVVAAWLPALLRQGTMYLLNLFGSDKEERWLTPSVPWLPSVLCEWVIWDKQNTQSRIHDRKSTYIAYNLGPLASPHQRTVWFHGSETSSYAILTNIHTEEHLHCMAVPQFAGYGHPDDVFPVHENMQKLPPTTRKRLAGNVA